MLKEQTGYGSTIEEAYEEAKTNLILSLGAEKFSEDDIQFDIIEMPKKKTLGIFGGCKAQVKAYIELPDAPKPKANKPKKEKKADKPKNKANAVTKEKEAPAEAKPVEEVATVSSDQIPADSRAGKAIAYLKNILEKLGCENIEIKVAEKENGAALYLSGDGLGVVIGHRGETLDALQYLTSLSANSANGYYKVTINIGNYRERREQALVGLARRISNQVLRSGRNRTLEPMNPYERRIIHTAVQDIEGVTSNSIGEGSGRRVVISPVGGGRPARKGGHSKPAAPAEARAPKKDSEIPLYGKIN